MWMILATAHPARASDPLVYVGNEAASVQRVADAARLRPDDLAPTPAASLRDLPVTVGSGGSVAACGEAPVSREQLQLAVQDAETALALGDAPRAAAGLARLAGAEACAVWDRELLVRYFVVVALTAEDGAAGFARARTLDPSLAWSDAWPDDRRAAFQAGAPQPPIRLAIPHPGFRVDGAPAAGPVQIVPGWHRVEGAGFDGAIELEADGTLLVPSSTTDQTFQTLDAEDARVVPTALLASRFGEGARVYVANDRGVWAATAGRTDWLSLQRQRRHPLVWGGLAAAAVGGAVSAAGGALAGLAAADARAANQAIGDATGPASLQSAQGAYDDASAAYGWRAPVLYGGLGLTAAGGALLGVGFALGPQTVGGR